VVSDSFGQIVGPLEGVADLRDFAFKVIPNIEFT
jgi:hypothetical protein